MAGLLLFLGLFQAGPAWGACPDWKPLGSDPPAPRAVTAADLIGLAGIGRANAEPVGGPSPLAISPDQRWAAFVLQHADLDENRYCQALVVIDLEGRVPAKVLDRGGDFQITGFPIRGTYIRNGFPQQIVPHWSPDGRSIAYLRRDRGTTQIWSVAAQGGAARQLTHESVDITAWTWMPDSRRIGYTVEPSQVAIEREIDAEARTGWVYDARVLPNVGFRPQAAAPLPAAFRTIDTESGASVVATEADTTWLRSELGDGSAAHEARRGRARAWTEPTAPSPMSPRTLRVIDAAGAAVPCPGPSCVGRFEGLWWDEAGRTLVFMKREGWDERYTALYRWTPGRRPPERVLKTDDLLERCAQARTQLLCIHETASQPSQIAAIDFATGAIRTIFDPNPGFDRLALAPVKRITWRNALGLEVYGDLVLPPKHQPGVPLPTIVTLYSSRGFLRGGTGNEYPIYLFARRGFAVLSIEGPPLYAQRFPALTTYDALNAANLKHWSERRSIQSAIAAGIKLLVDRKIADPKRLGITGLSDGASSVRFALINSRLFSAAALSSCCVDESSAFLVGPAWERYSRSIGYPPGFPTDAKFWKPYSLALNARTMRTPLLMQLADSEALYALPTITALRQYHQPVEMRVFPGEFHIKWQPQHRAAIYQTNLDWFDFWLNGKIDPDPAKAAEYQRWERLKKERAAVSTRESADP